MLQRGKSVSSGLLEAIEGSKLSIVVLSKNYANSRWCLEELVRIMERRNRHRQIVLPVSETKMIIMQQHSSSTKKNQQYVGKVKKWKKALKEVGELSGLHFQHESNRDDSYFARKIVKQVEDMIVLNVAEHPVGIESQVQELEDLLSLKTDDIRIVTICGLGGIGKTSIAKALFNKNCSLFEKSCFLADVRETTARPDGMITLQQRLISNVLIQNVPKIYSCDQGIEVIRQILWSQKVLIVLDDVDHIVQVKNLIINMQWLQQGSRVVLTTRNKSCVSSLDVKIYDLKPLDANNSLKLFCWHAFGKECPIEGYDLVSRDVVDIAQGSPMVLESLGHYMRGFYDIKDCQEALERLRIIPHDDVQGILKVSFDSLGPKEQELFMYITYFYLGMNKDVMFRVLEEEAPGYHSEYELKVLCNQGLVKIDQYRCLSMHATVRDMGREIVHRKSFDDPGRRRRLCNSVSA